MLRLLAAIAFAFLVPLAHAQDIGISANDTTQSVLVAQKGKPVTVRLRSGQEMTGTVREVNAKVMLLGAISGRELFDAVISLDAIDAVLIRTKK